MPKKIESNVQLLSVSVTEGRDGEVEILTGCDKPTAIDLLKRAWNKLSNSFPYSHEEYLRKKELVGKPQPGDSYPKSPMKNWLPRNIFAERTPWTARLLDLEQQRDAILHQIAEAFPLVIPCALIVDLAKHPLNGVSTRTVRR